VFCRRRPTIVFRFAMISKKQADDFHFDIIVCPLSRPLKSSKIIPCWNLLSPSSVIRHARQTSASSLQRR
jgi:hypothetical protein